jgi:hypothetical protein
LGHRGIDMWRVNSEKFLLHLRKSEITVLQYYSFIGDKGMSMQKWSVKKCIKYLLYI